ncbi:MAG: DUF4258 domain-containing protein [bacterium]|nr:DUF4258 domain-containing protein [bacterium]
MEDVLVKIREAFANHDYVLSLHASNRAAKRAIRSIEIEEAIAKGEIIEDYPNDKYGPSCLILGTTSTGRNLHVQVSYPPNVKVVTVYEPSVQKWKPGFRERVDL